MTYIVQVTFLYIIYIYKLHIQGHSYSIQVEFFSVLVRYGVNTTEIC